MHRVRRQTETNQQGGKEIGLVSDFLLPQICVRTIWIDIVESKDLCSSPFPAVQG